MHGMQISIKTHAGPIVTGRFVRFLSPVSMLIQTATGPRFLFEFEVERLLGCKRVEG